MAIKKSAPRSDHTPKDEPEGTPKPAPFKRPPQVERMIEQFIAGAPGKSTRIWEEPHVRDDVMVQLNVKQPEKLMLQVEWLARQEGSNKRKLVETILKEGVKARFKALGIPS